MSNVQTRNIPWRAQDMGLAFDDWDLDYYTNLFCEDMKRNPTNVELFDIAQVRADCLALPRWLSAALWPLAVPSVR